MGTLTIYYNSTSTSRYTESRTSYPSIYYNSTSTLRFTFSPSVTSKEIGCGGKVMSSNLVIGGKTIACSGKMMRTNVKATYAPALTKSTPTALSGALTYCVGTSIASSYVIFAGKGSIVNAYNASLTRTICTALDTNSLSDFAGSKIGNYGLFAGGTTGSTQSKVYAYNTSLTRSLPSALVSLSYGLAGGYNSSYAVFAGGLSAKVTAYNSSLTRSAPNDHGVRYGIAGTGIGSYALFAGGGSSAGSGTTGNTFYSDGVAYNTSLTKSTPSALSVGRKDFAAAPNSAYAIFAGGYGTWHDATSSYYDDNVDAYNTSLTRSTCTILNAPRTRLAAAGNYGYVMIAGGYRTNNSTVYSQVDTYSNSLTKSSATALSVARASLGGASVGNYAVFAGGAKGTTGYTNVDAYGYV